MVNEIIIEHILDARDGTEVVELGTISVPHPISRCIQSCILIAGQGHIMANGHSITEATVIRCIDSVILE